VGNLHFDRNENLMAMLRGSKKFTVFDPLQYANVYGGEQFVESQYEAEVVAKSGLKKKKSSGGGGGGGPSSPSSRRSVKVGVSADGVITNDEEHEQVDEGVRQDDEEEEVEVEVLAWRPSQSKKLKVEKIMSMSAYSPVNITSSKVYHKFPKFKQAIKYECEVQEGDVLYLPSRWWHEVESTPDKEGKAVAVNFWYCFN
jgi:hypothetical protein